MYSTTILGVLLMYRYNCRQLYQGVYFSWRIECIIKNGITCIRLVPSYNSITCITACGLLLRVREGLLSYRS